MIKTHRATDQNTLLDLSITASTCNDCGLHKDGCNIVFGTGPIKPKVMVIGEAPGYNEEIDGIPFTGKAGKLLDQILYKGMGLVRLDVYFANILKCRPPENRDPTPAETDYCTPWLDKQIELLDPELIITVGKHASQHVLGVHNATMGKMRGRIYHVDGRWVLPTWHPAYLLRQPDRNADVWSDLQLALDKMGWPIPQVV